MCDSAWHIHDLMGFCFSCCRRRDSPEREPLLSARTHSTESLPEPTSHIQKAIDVLAALKANKLPSQNQLNLFLQSVLRSDVLDVNGHGVTGYGPVSDDARKVILDLRECIEAVLQIGMEKNADNKLQDLLFQSSRIQSSPIRIDADVEVDRDVLQHIRQNGTP
ncbi:hypothetical protein PILCRDRAFT_16512 [Piloderma croceum F 1598]|uniref:HAM1-like N-terminal domain-containing protein n=1 Tax=Piloderma croceum (strain F 1598) TaxID=765440 RepID=A0A0C3EW31_PILCF|nr:hypothetical protein PILCRDRAFT_16512 [Piloderma croceum F 1598]